MELVQAAFSIDSSETGKCCVVSAWGDVQGYGKDYKTVNIKLTQNRADEQYTCCDTNAPTLDSRFNSFMFGKK